METAIDTKKRDLVRKINVAAYSELSIKVLNAYAPQTDNANYALQKLLKQRTEVALAFINTDNQQKKEELLEIFRMLSENIKEIIAL